MNAEKICSTGIKLAEVAEVEIDQARLARCNAAKDRAGRIGAQVFEALASRFSYLVGTLSVCWAS